VHEATPFYAEEITRFTGEPCYYGASDRLRPGLFPPDRVVERLRRPFTTLIRVRQQARKLEMRPQL
jgi:hypothetical protein